MNYSLLDLPDAGNNLVVYMDITLNEEIIGRIFIKLFREVFPAGVENFYRIASNRTYRIDQKGFGNYKFNRERLRTYQGCKFYNLKFNNYIVSGDIYNNDGTSAGTIFNDEPIPADFGEYYYPHDSKGLLSLVPYLDERTGLLFYDSSFMITLDNVRPTNTLVELDSDQIVIGQIYQGLEVIDRINELIRPFAGRKYPDFRIGKTDVYRKGTTLRRLRPITRIERQRMIKNGCCSVKCECRLPGCLRCNTPCKCCLPSCAKCNIPCDCHLPDCNRCNIPCNCRLPDCERCNILCNEEY